MPQISVVGLDVVEIKDADGGAMYSVAVTEECFTKDLGEREMVRALWELSEHTIQLVEGGTKFPLLIQYGEDRSRYLVDSTKELTNLMREQIPAMLEAYPKWNDVLLVMCARPELTWWIHINFEQ